MNNTPRWQKKWEKPEDDFGMPREGIFADITGDRRELLLQCIAFMAEKAYRRGFQQGYWCANETYTAGPIHELPNWRFDHTLHEALAPHVNFPVMFSIDRLNIECGGELYAMFGEHPMSETVCGRPRNRQQFD